MAIEQYDKNPMPQNIGTLDRVLRGLVGMWMIMTGIGRLFTVFGMIQVVSGICLTTSAATGRCAMMKWMNASTIPGQSNNVLNQLKQALPGQGTNPIQTQQASPMRETRRINPDEPAADAFAIA